MPLNDAARKLVETATKAKTAVAGGVGAGSKVLDKIPAVEIAEGKWKYVQIELSAPGELPKLVRRPNPPPPHPVPASFFYPSCHTHTHIFPIAPVCHARSALTTSLVANAR